VEDEEARQQGDADRTIRNLELSFDKERARVMNELSESLGREFVCTNRKRSYSTNSDDALVSAGVSDGGASDHGDDSGGSDGDSDGDSATTVVPSFSPAGQSQSSWSPRRTGRENSVRNQKRSNLGRGRNTIAQQLMGGQDKSGNRNAFDLLRGMKGSSSSKDKAASKRLRSSDY
jgi:hypothetical protein